MLAHFHRPTLNLCVGIVFTRAGKLIPIPNLQFSPNQHTERRPKHLKAAVVVSHRYDDLFLDILSQGRMRGIRQRIFVRGF